MDECVLGPILPEPGAAGDASSGCVQPIDGAGGQDAEGLAVSTSCPLDELGLHAWLPSEGNRSGRLHTKSQQTAFGFKNRVPRAMSSGRDSRLEGRSAGGRSTAPRDDG